jgi:hypothetical protein
MNTQNKFTPGPWYVQGPKISEVAAGQTYYAIVSRNPETRNGTYVVPGFYYPHSVQTEEESAANAQLIAAAPVMIEALQLLTQAIDLSKLDAKKDFSLLVAHAAATKAIRQATNNQ